MLLTVLTVATAVLTMSPYCLAYSRLIRFLNIPYKLLNGDKNFDKVLETLGIGWLGRHGYDRDKTPLLTLKWRPGTDVYTLTERSLTRKTVDTFKVVIILSSS